MDALHGTGTAETTDAGTYYATAHYAGDLDHSASSGNAVAVIINKDTTALTVLSAPSVSLGSGVKLTETVSLANGIGEQGTITFKLYDPNNNLVDTESVTNVSGNGSYSTPTGFLPTLAGSYSWVTSYGGDNNNSASSTPPYATSVLNNVVVNGADQVTVTPIGSSSTGSTGVMLGILNGNTYSTQTTTGSINSLLFNMTLDSASQFVHIASSITVPATVNTGYGYQSIREQRERDRQHPSHELRRRIHHGWQCGLHPDSRHRVQQRPDWHRDRYHHRPRQQQLQRRHVLARQREQHRDPGRSGQRQRSAWQWEQLGHRPVHRQ